MQSANIPAKTAVGSVSNLKFFTLHFPFDAYEPIEVHAFRLEPSFEGFAGFGVKLDEHFALKHIDENPLGAGGAAGLHALRKGFGALAGEAGKRVLGEVAWHRNSRT